MIKLFFLEVSEKFNEQQRYKMSTSKKAWQQKESINQIDAKTTTTARPTTPPHGPITTPLNPAR